MKAQFRIAARGQAQVKRPALMLADYSGMSAVRQFFRPYVLAFVALAIAVGGWSYGYKLSQYMQHPEVSKASATRMWVDHRSDAVAAPVQHTRPERISALALFAVPAPPRPHLWRDHIVTTPAPARVALVVSSHIPLRAPPSLHSSLA